MTEIPDKGVLIGTFTPDSELHFATYLFATREGLTIVGLTFLACYTFSVLALHAIAPALESHRLRAEAKLERRAFELHGSRWLGLFSRHDEAINGLRATLSIDATFVREMMPRNRVFISDTLCLTTLMFIIQQPLRVW